MRVALLAAVWAMPLAVHAQSAPAPTPPPLVEVAPAPPPGMPPVPPAPTHGSLAVEARLGLLLLQEASTLHSTAPAPSIRGAAWLGRHLELDVGYQFAYDEQGTNGVHATNTLHALDARLHYVYPLRSAQLTAGAGLVGYLETVQLTAYSVSQPTRSTLGWGIPVALGVETWVRRCPVRFETQLATRGERVDLLFATTVGWGTSG